MTERDLRRFAGFYLSLLDYHPDLLGEIVEWAKVKENLKAACKFLGPADVQKVHKLISIRESL